MKTVFIDTGIFLRCYEKSDDNPLRLEELLGLIEDGEINLILTQQVLDEYYRNRESKLDPSLKSIKALSKDQFQVPAFCADEKKIKEIKKLFGKISEKAKEAYKDLLKEAGEGTLRVDELFNKLVSGAQVIKISSEVLKCARVRSDKGNPPGKNGSYGDAINWEVLLKSAPKNENLYIIAVDGDFISHLDGNKLSEFLTKEWDKKKNSNIFLYKSIARFLKQEFDNTSITEEEITKEEKIHTGSGSALLKWNNVVPRATANSTLTGLPAGSAFFSETPLWEEKGEQVTCPNCGNIFQKKSYEIFIPCPACHLHNTYI